MSRSKTKLPWLLAALPLLGAVYAGCGSAGNSIPGFTGGDGGNGTSSGNSSGSSSGTGDDSATDSPTSNM